MKTHKLLNKFKTDREEMRSASRPATTADLLTMELRIEALIMFVAFRQEHIMSLISDYLAKQKTYNERNAAAVAALGTDLTGVIEDIAALDAKITELQNSQGEVTPEDAALINQLDADGTALVERTESVAKALKDLNELRPPPVPPPTP